MIDLKIVKFPEIKVAVVEDLEPPETEIESVRKLIEWRIGNLLTPEKHRTYGIHYKDTRTTPPSEYRVDIGISIESEVPPNKYGVVNKIFPERRSAVARQNNSHEKDVYSFDKQDIIIVKEITT